jgi:hypothetical protein
MEPRIGRDTILQLIMKAYFRAEARRFYSREEEKNVITNTYKLYV